MSTEYCAETVQPIVRDAVRRKLHLLSGVSEDDLMQEAMRRVWRAWPNYDPAKGAVSTFVNRCVHCEMLDQMRKLGRQQVRDGRAKAMFRARTNGFTLDAQDLDDLTTAVDWEQPLAEVAGRLYRQLHAAGAKRVRQGQRFYNMAQVVVVGLVMRKRGLSIRGTRELFRESEELRQAVRFMHLPSVKWFWGAAQIIFEKSVSTSPMEAA